MQILLIDDDSVTNFINKTVLNFYNESLRVQDFESAIDAVDYLKNSEVSTFLIFLDINMPIMSGWNFLDELRDLDLNHKMDINILSSSINESDRSKALSYALVNSFFEKPLSVEQLGRCL